MEIELLYFEGCPNAQRLRESLPGLLSRTGVAAALTLREITDAPRARQERFLGSPSLRIDGRDVEPGAGERTDYGLKCRIYQTAEGRSGLPADEWVLAALNARHRPLDRRRP